MSMRIVQVFCFRLAAVLARLEALGHAVSRCKGGSCSSVMSRGASAYTRLQRTVQANALKAFKVCSHTTASRVIILYIFIYLYIYMNLPRVWLGACGESAPGLRGECYPGPRSCVKLDGTRGRGHGPLLPCLPLPHPPHGRRGLCHQTLGRGDLQGKHSTRKA
jgi:hypothetical protein